MKRTTLITLLALVFALLMQPAFAEPAAVVQGVFDALIQEDSDYNQSTVKLNADMAEVSEIIYDAKDSYSLAILRFGAPVEGEIEPEAEVEADDGLAINTSIEDGRFIIRVPDPLNRLAWENLRDHTLTKEGQR